MKVGAVHAVFSAIAADILSLALPISLELSTPSLLRSAAAN
jgi:hypothetical protein